MPKFCYKTVFTLLAVFICFNCIGQTVQENTTPKSHKRLTPGKVALLGIIPGAGQVYNRKYWKVPVVYILMGGLAYYVHDNNTQYENYNTQLKELDKNSPTYSTDYSYASSNAAYYHRWRDLSALGLGLVYILSITDAYVDAHLMEFDVSEKLSLHIKPNAQYTYAAGFTPQLSLTLNFK